MTDHILLVSTDGQARLAMPEVLGRFGYQVTAVADGRDAGRILSCDDRPWPRSWPGLRPDRSGGVAFSATRKRALSRPTSQEPGRPPQGEQGPDGEPHRNRQSAVRAA